MTIDAQSVRAMKPSRTLRSALPVRAAGLDVDSRGGCPHAARRAPTGGAAAAMPARRRNDLRSMPGNLRRVGEGPVSQPCPTRDVLRSVAEAPESGLSHGV